METSGVKFDKLQKTNSGQPIFTRDEETADEIRATFVIDLAQLRSFGRGENGLSDGQKEFLLRLALWKIGKLLSQPFRYRSGCDLELVSLTEGRGDEKSGLNPTTLNLDPTEISRRMTRRTAAVLVTHMNGLPADMAAITQATEHRAAELGIAPPRIVVDAARAVGAATPSGPVGRDGWVTIFSFHRKKLMTTLGEGGMLVTDCPETAARLRRLRSFGQGETWGSSYRMTEFQAAVGSVQLRRLDMMNRRRIGLARARTASLMVVGGLCPPPEPDGYRHVYALYNLLLAPGSPASARDALRRRLAEQHGINTVVANPPTYHANRLIRAHTADQGVLPRAEAVAGRLLCPGLHPLMTDRENQHVGDALAEGVSALGMT